MSTKGGQLMVDKQYSRSEKSGEYEVEYLK